MFLWLLQNLLGLQRSLLEGFGKYSREIKTQRYSSGGPKKHTQPTFEEIEMIMRKKPSSKFSMGRNLLVWLHHYSQGSTMRLLKLQKCLSQRDFPQNTSNGAAGPALKHSNVVINRDRNRLKCTIQLVSIFEIMCPPMRIPCCNVP